MTEEREISLMTRKEHLILQLQRARTYFQRGASAFAEEDSGFAPTPEQFTVAAQVAHTAEVVDWFVEGAFGKGWDLDFRAFDERSRAVTSLDDANARLVRAFDRATATIRDASDAALRSPIPDERRFKGMPRLAIVNGIMEHTAHHRGALSVYARVMGKVPPMPYDRQ